MVLKRDSVHLFGDIVLYEYEWRKPEARIIRRAFSLGYEASSYECSVDLPLKKIRADLTFPMAKSVFSVVDLGMSFIIY